MARWLPGLLVAAVTLLAFLPSLQGEFLNWDDDENFLFNPHYRGLGWTQIRWMFTATHSGLYIPVTWLTLGLDYVLWGMDPRGYHLTSVVLHAINALLFYRVARRLLAAGFATPPHPALSPAGGEGIAAPSPPAGAGGPQLPLPSGERVGVRGAGRSPGPQQQPLSSSPSIPCASSRSPGSRSGRPSWVCSSSGCRRCGL